MPDQTNAEHAAVHMTVRVTPGHGSTRRTGTRASAAERLVGGLRAGGLSVG